ncbi:helix-turn-helix domain-containing protein [Dechloromonas sp. ARDL1]|uniref:AraC family transcriptional regulator n=1 Tax=Dechloromonas sp. ARDL1 TaxID=3322121 RepID=UPI003DA71488
MLSFQANDDGLTGFRPGHHLPSSPSIVTALAILFAGFSLFSALTLALTHFRDDSYRELAGARRMGLLLLLALAGLQLAHFAWLDLDQPWIDSPLYRSTLFAVAPAFFLFARPLLHPERPTAPNAGQLPHLLPLVIAPWLPPPVALPAAFVVGAGYLVWLGRSLYALRATRAGFRREMGLLGGVFAIAVGVAGLGLLQAELPGKLFYSLYATAIGFAFLLVQLALGRRPGLHGEIGEAARAAYAVSTLGQVDCPGVELRLQTLMQDERLYTDPELSLAALAKRLELSSHQLSELLNTRLGKGLARYLREWRIGAAREMLLGEPSASVLSVGLSVGFTSQSNFYEAFREIEGMTPGQYRKVNLAKNRD